MGRKRRSLDPTSPKAARAAELARELLTALIAASRGEKALLNDTLATIQHAEDPELLMHLLLAQATLTHAALARIVVAAQPESLSDEQLAQAFDAALRQLLADAAASDLRY
jgi:hypothetical protein